MKINYTFEQKDIDLLSHPVDDPCSRFCGDRVEPEGFGFVGFCDISDSCHKLKEYHRYCETLRFSHLDKIHEVTREIHDLMRQRNEITSKICGLSELLKKQYPPDGIDSIINTIFKGEL